MGRRADAKQEKTNKKINIKIVVLIVFLVALASGGIFYYTYKKNYEEMVKAVEVNTIYNGISVSGIDLSGKTQEEALETLLNELEIPLESQRLDITDNDRRYEYTFSHFGARYDIEDAVKKAYELGRSGELRARYKEIKKYAESGIDIAPQYSYDESYITNILTELKPQFDVPAKNSVLTRANGVFTATDEQSGYELDIESTASKIKAQLDTVQAGEVIAETKELLPTITKEENMKATTLIGSYSTSFTNGPGSEGRNENLRLACASVNGTLIAPGQVFSMNATLGPQTYANGYKDAGVYVNGKVEQGVGGGVCQVTTTLYNAVINAELDIVERSNHSLTVAYVPMGMDAAIAGTYKDLKFKNSTDYPVYLEAYLSGNKIITNVYGNEIHGSGHTVKYVTEYVGSIPKPAEKVTNDPNLPEGERVVTYTGKVGHKVNTYKVVYENGQEVSRKLFNTSTYRATADEVKVGTKKVETAPAETTTAEATTES
ncbi:MAG: VanW family protein [Tyzzerella sp.]|uniref:VanW family protein n=1 Tax=Candidatus Fimicola merdigallinarum TaxID=2840819 RepID=A0A9D9H3F6_9FIRM|nr:VanW family protein [Candidatus Fimicola merdigallinarum]